MLPLALTLAICAAPAPKLVVVPLGDTSPALVEFVVRSIERRFHLRVEVARARPLPPKAWYAPRKRWRADKILDHLDAMSFPGAWKVAAITEAPISTTKGKIYDWGIAGLGSLGGKSSVFTSYLFRGFRRKKRTYHRFMENLIIHELGHTLGLDHCPKERCLMADAKGNAVRAARRSINEFCPDCHGKIQAHLRATEVQGRW